LQVERLKERIHLQAGYLTGFKLKMDKLFHHVLDSH